MVTLDRDGRIRPRLAPARREVVRAMVTRGLSERRALAVVHMSAASLRYAPEPDRNTHLRARTVAWRIGTAAMGPG